jgi:hypothetical protein
MLDELEGKSLTELAVLCGGVASNPGADSATVKKAHALRLEWVRLQHLPHPALALKESQQLEAQRESLRKRMVEFLSAW